MSDVVPIATTATTRPFEALMAVEGRWTGDGRFIMVDGLTWDGLLPESLKLRHDDDAPIVGRIDTIERVPGASADERFIIGRGVIDLGCAEGIETARQVENEFLRGVSIEPDAVIEGGVDPDTVEPGDEMWLLVVESARIRTMALTPTAAFAEAYITLGTVDTNTAVPVIEGPDPISHDEAIAERDEDDEPVGILIASGHTITIPDCPPASWFHEPIDVEITGALTVTDAGRVYGMLAPGDVGHIGRPDRMLAPMGNVNYAPFMRGETPVDGGGRVVTGNITMGCGHGRATSAAGVVEHYDNTCSVVATAACGEWSGEGVWVAGALLPGVTPDQVRRMMACQLSGHWLPNDAGGRDLVAALLVPVPAYSHARRQASVTVRSGQLVASAVPVRFAPTAPADDCGCHAVAASAAGERRPKVADLDRRLAVLERSLRPQVAAGLARRIRGE